MKDHWNFNCSKCGKDLQIRIGKNQIGDQRKVTCLKCGAETKTTIGVKSEGYSDHTEAMTEVPPETMEKIRDLIENMITNSENEELLRSIRKDGFGLIFTTLIIQMGDKQNLGEMVDSSGEIKPGVFTEEDEEAFKKSFRIKF